MEVEFGTVVDEEVSEARTLRREQRHWRIELEEHVSFRMSEKAGHSRPYSTATRQMIEWFPPIR